MKIVPRKLVEITNKLRLPGVQALPRSSVTEVILRLRANLKARGATPGDEKPFVKN